MIPVRDLLKDSFDRLDERHEKKYWQNPEPRNPSRMEDEVYHMILANGLRPERQFRIGSYFADFALHEKNTVIEYDGKYHLDTVERDIKRDRYMNSQGWTVYRVWKNGKWFEAMEDGKTIIGAPNLQTVIEHLVTYIGDDWRYAGKSRRAAK